MNRFIIVFLILLSSFAYCDTIRDVGIAKYAVLEVAKDKTPVREDDNDNAKRMTHLLKDTVLFADKQTDKYYRVEFDPDTFGWINKNDIEVQAIIPEKRYEGITKINFREDKKNYFIDILTPFRSAWIFKENDNDLNFKLFDNDFDSLNTDKSFNKKQV